MRRVEASAEIAASPGEVFDFLADPANLPRWQTGIVSAERTSPDPVGVGSTARVVRELAGQRMAVDLAITAYEAGRRLVLESAVSGIAVEATLDLSPRADATTDLRFEMTIRAQNVFMGPIEGMVAGAAEHDLADSLRRLQAVFADPSAADR
ncbi:MAG: SRPBCC family protein [Candidatus Limnocylindria bacterium]